MSKRKKRNNISYEHIANNAIELFQRMEKESGEKVHSYNEWLNLLKGELKKDEES